MCVCACVLLLKLKDTQLALQMSLKVGGSFPAPLVLILNIAGAAHLGDFPVGFPEGKKQLRALVSPKV